MYYTFLYFAFENMAKNSYIFMIFILDTLKYFSEDSLSPDESEQVSKEVVVWQFISLESQRKCYTTKITKLNHFRIKVSILISSSCPPPVSPHPPHSQSSHSALSWCSVCSHCWYHWGKVSKKLKKYINEIIHCNLVS